MWSYLSESKSLAQIESCNMTISRMAANLQQTVWKRKRVEVLQWQSQSSDCNLTEMLWWLKVIQQMTVKLQLLALVPVGLGLLLPCYEKFRIKRMCFCFHTTLNYGWRSALSLGYWDALVAKTDFDALKWAAENQAWRFCHDWLKWAAGFHCPICTL